MKQIPLEEDLYKYAIGEEVSPTNAKYNALLEVVMTDKNYSVGKEKVMCFLAGVNHNPAKHDYDGVKIVRGVSRQVEVKPTTYWGNAKLNMKCAFADYTPERFTEDKKVNPIMVVGGFNMHRLLYAVMFDFNSPTFVAAIKRDMDKDKKAALAKPGRRFIPKPMCRDIEQIDNIELLYPPNKSVLDANRHTMTGCAYNLITKLLIDQRNLKSF